MSWIEERIGKKRTTYRYCDKGQRPQKIKARNMMEAEAIKTTLDHRALFSEHGLPITDMSWAEFREEYYRGYEPSHSSQSTIKLKHVVLQFERIVQPKMLIGVRDIQAEDWQIARSKEISARSCNMEMSYLSPMFVKALHRKYIQVNPFGQIKRLRTAATEPRALSPAESDAFLESIAMDSPAHTLLAQFAYETGMRLDEISHQRMEDIDFIQGIIKVEPHTDECSCVRCKDAEKPGWIGKAGVPRRVPLSPSLQKGLLDAFQGTPKGCIFPCCDTIQHAFKRAHLAIGIKDGACVHIFRHTLAVEMERAGVRRSVLKAILGHGRADTTDTYTGHVSPEELRSEFQKLLDWRKQGRNVAVIALHG